MRALLRTSVVLFSLLACTTGAWAATATWQGSASPNDLWATTGNWSTGALPASGTPVVIDNSSTGSTINTGTSQVTFGLYGGDGMTITASRDITFTGGSGTRYYCYSNKALTVDPQDGLAHTYTFTYYTVMPPTSASAKDPIYDIRGLSTVVFPTNANLTIGTNSFTKSGTGTMQLGTSSYPNQTWEALPVTNITGGVMDLKTLYGSIAGLANLSNCWMNISSGATLWMETASGGALRQFTNQVSFKGSGQVVLNSSLNGSGTVKTMITNGSTFAPGDLGTSGKLSMVGNVTFSLPTYTVTGVTACTLKIDITGSGTTAGNDFDQLAISGNITTLNNCDLIVNATGAVAGNSYTFLTSGNSLASAVFKSTTVNNVPTGLSYTVAPIASTGNLGYQIAFTPEPAAMSLLVLGGLAMLKRKR